jgi:hypothetical protein
MNKMLITLITPLRYTQQEEQGGGRVGCRVMPCGGGKGR